MCKFLVDASVRGEDTKLFDIFSAEERAQLFTDIKIELARAQVSYAGLVDPPEHFHIFRRVPIQHNLTEFAFMSMIGSLEAAFNLVALVLLKKGLESDKKKPNTTSPSLLASSIPKALK